MIFRHYNAGIVVLLFVDQSSQMLNDVSLPSLGIAITTGHIIIFAIKTSPLVSISPCNEDKVSAQRAYLSGRVDLTRRCSTK
jgi:hypothetical protein